MSPKLYRKHVIKNDNTVIVPTRFQISKLSLPVNASTQPATFVAFGSHILQTVSLLSIIVLHHNIKVNGALPQDVYVLSRSVL